MIGDLFKKSVRVLPVEEQWEIVNFSNYFESLLWDLRHYGLKITIHNFIFIVKAR